MLAQDLTCPFGLLATFVDEGNIGATRVLTPQGPFGGAMPEEHHPAGHGPVHHHGAQERRNSVRTPPWNDPARIRVVPVRFIPDRSGYVRLRVREKRLER